VCQDGAGTTPDVCDGQDNDCSGVADDPSCAGLDADANGRVDGGDLALLGRAFGLCDPSNPSPWWGTVDFNHDGCVDGDDLSVLANLWGAACSGGVLACR